MLDGGKWSKHNEQFILSARNTLILLALEEGFYVLVDDTNLVPKHEQTVREMVRGIATVDIKDFTHVPLETCIERDLKRPNSVGERVIRRMYRQFLYKPPVPPIYSPALPDALMCDLDGSLALLHGRNPYDASLCEQDLLNAPVDDILTRYLDDCTILLVSGRSEEHRPQTERWLLAHKVSYGYLFMRTAGDSRKDAIIKREIYEQHIQGKWNIRFVLDDRDQCVHLWREELGLPTFQVADGDF